ncbi:MAG TPA: PEP-CTERM sorting domain-containing protein [Pseudomonadales bacterium]|nr:PEP-CTERM sorting domain-containing protein [Pseudomonadales bacterium]
MKKVAQSLCLTSLLVAPWLSASTLYLDGVAPTDSSLIFGDHLIGGVHTSVAGVGGSGFSNAGDVLDGQRTYTYDFGAQPDLTDGVANRGDTGFAMMIWDMGQSLDSMRLYTHQDHYSGGPITTDFIAQDVMEYSVWGSHDGDHFVLLSDVIGYNINGGGAGKPTYTFNGTAPTVVYRGGSAEYGTLNSYTREYVFADAYQYYGIRTSQISLTAKDADPEIDAIAGFKSADRCATNPNDPSCVSTVSEPGSLTLLGLGLLAGAASRIKRVFLKK